MTRTSLTALREEMRAVAGGRRGAPPRPAAALLSALSPEALDLLKVILQERPESIARVVELTGRAQPNVSRSLQLLSSHGLLRLVKAGREVRPEPIVQALVVDLTTGTYQTRALDPAA